MLNLKTQSKQTKQKQSYIYNGEKFVDTRRLGSGEGAK